MSRRRTSLLVVTMVALAVTAAAAAKPHGAVNGTFSKSILADKSLAQYMKASVVWCVWSKGHVIVHVSIKNGSAAHVTATIEPRYSILRGGDHGDGLTNTKNFGFDANAFRSLWIDAGAPKGITANAPISKCDPYLLLLKAG